MEFLAFSVEIIEGKREGRVFQGDPPWYSEAGADMTAAGYREFKAVYMKALVGKIEKSDITRAGLEPVVLALSNE